MTRFNELLLVVLVLGSIFLFYLANMLRGAAWHQRGMERVRRLEQWRATGELAPVGPTREYRHMSRFALFVCILSVAAPSVAFAAPYIGASPVPAPHPKQIYRITGSDNPNTTATSPATGPTEEAICGSRTVERLYEAAPPDIAAAGIAEAEQTGANVLGCPLDLQFLGSNWSATYSTGAIQITNTVGDSGIVLSPGASFINTSTDLSSIQRIGQINCQRTFAMQVVYRTNGDCEVLLSDVSGDFDSRGQ